MRDFKGMKRQRGRNRGGGGGKPQQQNANRAFDSNGPDGVKVRGNAQHVFEKYQQLARDASASGDRVLAENYLQHAEHYFRLLRALQPQRPASEILGRDQFSSGFDIDFEDEGGQAAQAQAAEEAAEGGEGQGESESERGWREDRPRDERRERDRDGFRDDRPREERRDRFEARDGQGRRDRWRDDRPREERPRDERPRDERPRDERQREDRRDDRPRDDRRDDRPRDERRPEDRPRDERRDRFEADERPSRMLRDAEGGESHAPAFLQAAPAPVLRPEGEDEAPRKPRRRRAPRDDAGQPEEA